MWSVPSRGLRSNPRAVSTSRRTPPASRWPAPMKVRRCAQGYEARPGGHRARLILGSRSGVNRCAIQHNRVFCKVAPVARRARLVAQPLRLRLRALRVRRSSVMSCAPLASAARPARSPRSTASRCGHGCAVTAKVPVSAAAPRAWCGSPRPPRPVSRCGVVPPAASLLARPVCLSFPSAPAQRGLPKGKTRPVMRCKPRSRLAPHARACLLPCASRPSPSGARAARP